MKKDDSERMCRSDGHSCWYDYTIIVEICQDYCCKNDLSMLKTINIYKMILEKLNREQFGLRLAAQAWYDKADHDRKQETP